MEVPQKWMGYFMERPIETDDDWGYPHFWDNMGMGQNL